jgi:hypothetical protein
MITGINVTQCTASAAGFLDGVFFGTFGLTALILLAIRQNYKKKDTK